MSQLTQAEEQHLVSLIDKLDRHLLPLDVFNSVASKIVLVALELIVINPLKNGKLEFLLTQRPLNDKFWPGKWHNPGTILRPTDLQTEYTLNYEIAFKRLIANEIQTDLKYAPILIGSLLSNTARGVANSLIFYSELNALPKQGKFFSLNNLPENYIESTTTLLKMVETEYRKRDNK